MDAKVQKILHELRARLRAHYGERLAKLVLYGSQARGDAAEGSDIDVLVVLNGEVRAAREIDETVDMVAEVSLSNECVVSCAFVSADEFEKAPNPFLRNVRREGIAL